MQWLSDHRGTVTAGPNFSWVLAARALRRMHGLDLSALRIALNGAEPVDPETVDAFVTEATRFGMRPEAVFPAFGMAEVGIAGTFPVPLTGLRTDSVDRLVLESERYAAPAPRRCAQRPLVRDCSANRFRVSRSVSSIPRPALAFANVRSVSSRSGVRR